MYTWIHTHHTQYTLVNIYRMKTTLSRIINSNWTFIGIIPYTHMNRFWYIDRNELTHTLTHTYTYLIWSHFMWISWLALELLNQPPLSLSLSLSLSHTHTRTHTRTHTHISFDHISCEYLGQLWNFQSTISLSLSLSHTHAHTRSHRHIPHLITFHVNIFVSFRTFQSTLSLSVSLSLSHTLSYIYIYIYISSSCRAVSTDILDHLSPLLPLIHRLRQVFWVTSCVLT